MLAVSWASCAWRCESWRDFDAEVGTVERRLVVCDARGVRVVEVAMAESMSRAGECVPYVQCLNPNEGNVGGDAKLIAGRRRLDRQGSFNTIRDTCVHTYITLDLLHHVVSRKQGAVKSCLGSRTADQQTPHHRPHRSFYRDHSHRSVVRCWPQNGPRSNTGQARSLLAPRYRY